MTSRFNCLCQQSNLCTRLRPGNGSGATRSARISRHTREARRYGQIWNPSGCGSHAGPQNVLLAEANVPYSSLYELEQINPEFPSTDVAVVIGANDVVNPDARD